MLVCDPILRNVSWVMRFAGVELVYDRHSYTDEKADALQRLSGLLEQIINPAPANVVPLKPRR